MPSGASLDRPDPGRPDLGLNAPDVAPAVQAVFDHLDEAFMLIDADNRILLWNRAFLTMLELPERLLAPGADVFPLIRVLADRGDYGPGDPEVLAAAIADNIRHRKAAVGERQMADGKIIAVEWQTLPDQAFMFRMRDVTTERIASRFQDELIATVSHELRTPLTTIIGALGLLRGGDVQGDRATQLIDMAQKNGERLARLVNDLLDVEKLKSEALHFQFEPSDLGLLLTSAVEQIASYALNLGVDIDLELPDAPVSAEVDRGRLLQVLSNLLSNAAKFSRAGSRVRLRLEPGSQSARISVIDRGRGMSADFARRLFTRFSQENRNSENGQSGTGLGLAICKSIVDRHGGQIHVDTREGVGTIFHVDLPYAQEAAGD